MAPVVPIPIPIPIHEEQHDTPLCTVEAVLLSGSADDPENKEGLCRHAAELLRRGAGSRGRIELDRTLDALGASIDVEVDKDSTHVVARCLRRNLEPTLELLADVLARPAFEAAEHEKLRRESLSLLDDLRDDDAALCGRWFEHWSFRGHPYAKSALGTEASLAAMTRDDAVAWATTHISAESILLGFAGDLDQRTARALGDRLLANLRRGRSPAPTPPRVPGPATDRCTLVCDKPDRQQVQILIGHPGPAATSPDWLPLAVAAAAFGGTFTARLMTEVRVKRGWSYGASCRLGRGRLGGAFRIHVFPDLERAPETLALVLKLWEELCTEGLGQEELVFVKSYLMGSWALEIDTPTKRLGRRLDSIVMGLPDDYHLHYVNEVSAISADQVNAAIRKHWHPEAAAVVLVASAESLVSRLCDAAIGPVEVIPFDAY